MGNNLHYTETAQADFQQGTLTGVQATAEGDLSLIVPTAPTFSRSSVAYKSDGTQVATNAPRFEAGKFGQAVMVEEGTTNYVVNPTTQKTIVSPASGYNQYDYTHSHPYGGVAQSQAITYAISFELKQRGAYPFGSVVLGGGAGGDPWNIRINRDLTLKGTGVTGSVITKPLADGWKRYECNITIPTTGYLQTFIKFIGEYGTGAVDSDVRNVQLEQKPYATSFTTNTRAAETLTIPRSVLNPAQGTIQFSVFVDPNVHNAAADWKMAFSIADLNEHNQIRFGKNSKGNSNWHAKFEDNAGNQWLPTFNINPGWRKIAITWNQSTSTAKVYVDGVIVAQNTNAPIPASFANCLGGAAWIGSWISGNLFQINSYIDDLRISSRARTDAEILADYQSSQPLQADADTTWKMTFDGDLRVGLGGYRVTPALDLSTVGTASSSTISWDADIPAGTSVVVETSIDGGQTWQTATNGGEIPGITRGLNLAGKSLLIRETLTTSDASVTPTLHSLDVNVMNLSVATPPAVGMAVTPLHAGIRPGGATLRPTAVGMAVAAHLTRAILSIHPPALELQMHPSNISAAMAIHPPVIALNLRPVAIVAPPFFVHPPAATLQSGVNQGHVVPGARILSIPAVSFHLSPAPAALHAGPVTVQVDTVALEIAISAPAIRHIPFSIYPVLIGNDGKPLAVLEKVYDFYIQDQLLSADAGEEVLCFSLPGDDPKASLLQGEMTVRAYNRDYVVRVVDGIRDQQGLLAKQVTAEATWYDLATMEPIQPKTWRGVTAHALLTDLLAGTGWGLGRIDPAQTADFVLSQATNPLVCLRQAAALFGAELFFDTRYHLVHLVNQVGQERPDVLFAEGKNVQSIDRKEDTRGLVTRLYAYGKDGLTIANANNGKPYLEDYSYFDQRGLPRKVLVGTFSDDRYTDANALLERAQYELSTQAKPAVTYALALAVDVQVELGDRVWVYDAELKVQDRFRVSQRQWYPLEPWRTQMQLNQPLPRLSSQISDIALQQQQDAQQLPDVIQYQMDQQLPDMLQTQLDQTLPDMVQTQLDQTLPDQIQTQLDQTLPEMVTTEIQQQAEAYIEYGVASYSGAGVQFAFVNKYSQLPVAVAALQGSSAGVTFACTPIQDRSGNYTGMQVTPQGSAPSNAYISMIAICKGVVA